jgi:hypothetical protein
MRFSALRFQNFGFQSLDFSFGTSKLPGRNYATRAEELVNRFSSGVERNSSRKPPAPHAPRRIDSIGMNAYKTAP